MKAPTDVLQAYFDCGLMATVHVIAQFRVNGQLASVTARLADVENGTMLEKGHTLELRRNGDFVANMVLHSLHRDSGTMNLERI